MPFYSRLSKLGGDGERRVGCGLYKQEVRGLNSLPPIAMGMENFPEVLVFLQFCLPLPLIHYRPFADGYEELTVRQGKLGNLA